MHPLFHANYQKNLMSKFREKLVVTDGRGSTEFIGPSGYAGGPINIINQYLFQPYSQAIT